MTAKTRNLFLRVPIERFNHIGEKCALYHETPQKYILRLIEKDAANIDLKEEEKPRMARFAEMVSIRIIEQVQKMHEEEKAEFKSFRDKLNLAFQRIYAPLVDILDVLKKK